MQSQAKVGCLYILDAWLPRSGPGRRPFAHGSTRAGGPGHAPRHLCTGSLGASSGYDTVIHAWDLPLYSVTFHPLGTSALARLRTLVCTVRRDGAAMRLVLGAAVPLILRK